MSIAFIDVWSYFLVPFPFAVTLLTEATQVGKGLILFNSWFKILVNCGGEAKAGGSWVDHILSREAEKDEPGNGATHSGHVLSPQLMAVKVVPFRYIQSPIFPVSLDSNQVGNYFVYSSLCCCPLWGGGGYCKAI